MVWAWANSGMDLEISEVCVGVKFYVRYYLIMYFCLCNQNFDVHYIHYMGRATKATKKYAASGQLKKAIQARHKHQQIQKKIQGRKGKQRHREQNRPLVTEDVVEEDESPKATKKQVFLIYQHLILV